MLNPEFRFLLLNQEIEPYLFAAAIVCTTNLGLLLGLLLGSLFVVYKLWLIVPKLMDHDLLKFLTPEKIVLIIPIIIIIIICKIVFDDLQKRIKELEEKIEILRRKK